MRGVLPIALIAVLAAAAPAPAETADVDLPAGGMLRSTIFPSSEVEVVRVPASAGAVATVDLRALGRTAFRPSLAATLSDGSEISPVPTAAGRFKASFPFPVDGVLELRVGAATGVGHYRLRARLAPKPAGMRPARVDLREAGDPTGLLGGFTLFALRPGAGASPAAITGGVEFRARGRAATELVGFGLPEAGTTLPAPAPIAGTTGTWFATATHAAIALDLGEGNRLDGEYALAAGGDILHAGLGDPAAPLVSLALRLGPPPTVASLAGSWSYTIVAGEGEAATIEVGTLSFGPSGTASGLGARSPLSGGGEPATFLRTGTFSVQADGTVVVTTRENIIGPQSSWSVRDVFAGDVLAGLPDAAGDGGLRLLLRQGTGLGNADFQGDYLLLGATLGETSAIRSGTVTFDGAGAFSGTGAVIPAVGDPIGDVSLSGTCSVNALGNATLTFEGGAAATGVAGPEARYLLAVGAGEATITVDLLLRAE